MALTSSYLVAVSKLGELLHAARSAQAPERFTTRFLASLGYKSTNDRLFIGLLKALGFLDPSGAPKQRFYDYLDETRSKQVLAEGIQEAYEDLFRVNRTAHKMDQQQVKSKLKSLTQGQYSDNVLSNMARTFVELVKHADFQSPKARRPEKTSEAASNSPEVQEPAVEQVPGAPSGTPRTHTRVVDSLAYRIEVVLPATRDKSIYDAIFKSIKEHLL
jgi:hypothetical protein